MKDEVPMGTFMKDRRSYYWPSDLVSQWHTSRVYPGNIWEGKGREKDRTLDFSAKRSEWEKKKKRESDREEKSESL